MYKKHLVVLREVNTEGNYEKSHPRYYKYIVVTEVSKEFVYAPLETFVKLAEEKDRRVLGVFDMLWEVWEEFSKWEYTLHYCF